MKTLYLDPFSGVSGNMLLGTLFDLGLDFNAFKNELAKLKLTGYHLSLTKTTKSAITGHLFEVSLTSEFANHHVDEGAQKIHHHGRNLATIEDIINNSTLNAHIKKSACTVFEEIAKAEAHVHEKKIDEIHFHEIGAIDSIIDITGFFIGLNLLKIDKLICGPLVDGTGTIKVAHGVMPVPVPAVMQMRTNSAIPFRQRMDVDTELVTPTGFGIIKCATTTFGEVPENLILEKIGYGFGTRQINGLNALRSCIYNSLLSNQKVIHSKDQIILIETNLDDTTGQELSDVMAILLTNGAKDAWVEPITMKKGRPAHKLCLLADPTNSETLTKIIFEHTSSIGVRQQLLDRKIMQRDLKLLKTKFGNLHVKYLSYAGITKVSLEHDDLVSLAQKNKLPIKNLETKIMNLIQSD
ncbi:nickel pincer cofactor biosynthesis protein LarC [Ligilactobacillus sp. WILCCON 0076]|uniref:Pyridinium-3,5-bisthiocarboxylic acid mononucleotide nickel insertion protein n=1 Tax=Ligilactobacillus ubinensis TaxID=2876789 RepID=A0A9X2FK50_9LACO|nr:nickel pincer cofactor biosynthesis protein LarC [Ligilactobacillus ubinensis]MCP0885813.1 nickel pincer cofactor biosynthesis protein LarC [Ligilactobacillus ubinensis]